MRKKASTEGRLVVFVSGMQNYYPDCNDCYDCYEYLSTSNFRPLNFVILDLLRLRITTCANRAKRSLNYLVLIIIPGKESYG